ncbi:MAG: glycosyl hydrolase 53 family protein [Flavobacteriaceae bacterium]|nr:glycosyl hydrolase 53 family protein [Flavobacteriaceae bacterium]
MKNTLYLVFILLVSCSKEAQDVQAVFKRPFMYAAVDLSYLPQLRKVNTVFYDQKNQPRDLLSIVSDEGVNTVRLRIWVSPETESSSFEEVKRFSKELKEIGMKVWITVHYSDTWADPGSQQVPEEWNGLSQEDLLVRVYEYTQRIVEEIAPDIIQIGNEVNNGFMFPYGSVYKHQKYFFELMTTGVAAVRASSDTCKIMIHVAGLDKSEWFFGLLKGLDYDMIGISYYPKWHGKNMEVFASEFNNLSQQFGKDILIAETAYPFTLDWNDWTHNVMGEKEALIWPKYPATERGQLLFFQKVKEIVLRTEKGRGFCYWGAALVAFDGVESTKGSAWENQALFDFNSKVLPAMHVFNVK